MISKLQEKMNSYQRVWAEIDLDAIWENMIHMKENIAPETKILAVIKTDGYGHGGVPIARMLEDVDFMFGYAAATYEEAHVLREAGVKKPILILGLLAQGMNAIDAAVNGVYLHGRAGELAAKLHTEYGVMAGDIADCLMKDYDEKESVKK